MIWILTFIELRRQAQGMLGGLQARRFKDTLI